MLSQVIQFLQTSFEFKRAAHLANGLVGITAELGLKCCVNVRMHYDSDYFGCEAQSIEAKVFDRFCTSGTILDFGSRTLVNGNNISLLIKNMPLDKPDVYGRMKDHLMVLMRGAEACLKSIFLENQLELRQEGIQNVLEKSQSELKEIHILIDQQGEATRDMLATLSTKMEGVIFSLGLEEDQEQAIMAILDKSTEDIQALAEISAQVGVSFKHFIKELDKLIE